MADEKISEDVDSISGDGKSYLLIGQKKLRILGFDARFVGQVLPNITARLADSYSGGTFQGK